MTDIHNIKFDIQDTNIGCDVYGISYECAGHPIKFYLCLVIVAILFLVIYAFCAFYACMWLGGVMGLNSMSKVMYR